MRWRARWSWVVALAVGCAPEPGLEQAPEADADRDRASAIDDNNARERFDLPPLEETSVTGPDEDGDHIRDDIERYIEEQFADNEWARLSARQYARAIQHLLSRADDRERALDAADEATRGMVCMIETLGHQEGARALGELRATTVDTEERLLAYLAADRALSGGVFRLPEPEDSCAFDTEGLSP